MGDYSFTNIPNLGGVRDAHHVITQYVISNSLLLKTLQDLHLVDFTNYNTNGVPLFRSALAGFEDGSAAHIGNHPYLRYFQFDVFAQMGVRFEQEVLELLAGGTGIDLADARAQAAAGFVGEVQALQAPLPDRVNPSDAKWSVRRFWWKCTYIGESSR